MKKKLLVGLFAIIICFTLVGCGKEEDSNNSEETTGENESQKNNSEQKNNNDEENVKLYSDDNKIVFNYSDVYYIVYYYEGNQITGLEYVYKCEDDETAKITKYMLDSTYEEEENVKDIKQKGKNITVTFTEGAYENETLESVKSTYSFLEQIYKND